MKIFLKKYKIIYLLFSFSILEEVLKSHANASMWVPCVEDNHDSYVTWLAHIPLNPLLICSLMFLLLFLSIVCLLGLGLWVATPWRSRARYTLTQIPTWRWRHSMNWVEEKGKRVDKIQKIIFEFLWFKMRVQTTTLYKFWSP